jgi:hypothetical protein
MSDPSELDEVSAARLGELACRAGDEAAATRLLARSVPAESVRARLDEIECVMHWIDARLTAERTQNDGANAPQRRVFASMRETRTHCRNA